MGKGSELGMRETRVFIPTLTLTLKNSSTFFGLAFNFLNFLLALNSRIRRVEEGWRDACGESKTCRETLFLSMFLK